MAASSPKISVRRHFRCLSQLRVVTAVSFLVMVLLTIQPSFAKRLPLGDVVKVTESASTDFPVLDHQSVVKGHLRTVSALPPDVQRWLTLLHAGQPELPNERFVYGGDRGLHLYARAPSPSGKDKNLQLSLKDYNLTKKPYHKVMILNGEDTIVDQLDNRVWDSNNGVKAGSPADDENEGNSDLHYSDQEMAESIVISDHEQNKAKRSLRLPRSPVTSRDFLGVLPGLYGFGVNEGQADRFFHVPFGYDRSEPSVSAREVNNNQRYIQEGQWNIETPQNTRTTEFSKALYPLQQSNSLQTRNLRGKILPHTSAGERESFRNEDLAHSALGREYDTRNTFHGNLRNYISRINVSQEKTLPNKKRDLSREHVTLGENRDTETSQKTALYRSAVDESNKYDRQIFENAVMGMIIRGEELWDKIGRSQFDKQFPSVSQDEPVSLPSEHNIPIALSEQVVSILPTVDKSSGYDHVIGPLPQVEHVYGSADERALVLETGDQQKFWLEGESGLLYDNVFSRPGDQSGLSPTVEPHLGIRIFKRSVGTGGLRRGGVPHLVKRMQELADSHMSATLAKRSPLSTGYVAGLDADADHQQRHDHMVAAATADALHQAHHHDSIPPAVILSSGHHHSEDIGHHLVAKSETTAAGTAGGAGSGRGPNQEDSGPGALVVLHPPHPLEAAHADDDTIHVIAAVPFAVAHHHELHHEADHVLTKSTTLTLAQHDTDPHVVAKTTTVTTVTQHDSVPLLVVHGPDAPVVLLHHPPASQSSTSTTTVHKPPVVHNLLRVPLGGFGVGVTYGGAGAGHGFYAAG